MRGVYISLKQCFVNVCVWVVSEVVLQSKTTPRKNGFLLLIEC